MSTVKRQHALRREASWSRGATVTGTGQPPDYRNTAGSSGPISLWPGFVEAAADRLRQGRVVYGDRSFFHEPDRLVREIEEELLDVAVWAFILWTRIRHLPVTGHARSRHGTRRQIVSAGEKRGRRGSMPKQRGSDER